MKVTNLRRTLAAALVAGGMFVGGSSAVAQTIDHFVGDASFDDTPVDAGLGYSYFDGPPDTAWESTGNWWYNSTYDPGRRPTPRTGDQALHGGADYNWQVLGDTFETGHTYNLSMYVQGDSDAVDAGDAGTDRVWVYIFNGSNAVPDPLDGFFDDESLYAASFEQDGTAGTTIGGVGFTDPFSGFNRSGGSEWTKVGINFTAGPGVAGNQIGIAFYGRGDAAFDDVSVTSVIPEPSTVVLAGLMFAGGISLLRRR